MPTKRAIPARKPVIIAEPAESVAKRTFIILTVATGFFLLLAFLYLIRPVLLWVVGALIITLALAPAVSWLVKKGWNRALAAAVSLLLTLVLVASALTAIATPFVTQADDLAREFPRFVADLTKNDTIKKLDKEFHIVDRARDASKSAPDYLSGAGTTFVNTAKSAVTAVATAGVILTLAFFLLLEGPSSWQKFIALLPPHDGRRVDHIGRRIARAISGFVSGNLLISLIAGTVALITFLALGIPYAVPLAVLVALFDLIPLVGALIATMIAALVALSVGVVPTVILVAVMLVYQQLEGNVIQPYIYSRTVQLSPLLILVASIIGATLGGIVGVLLAIPAAATAQIIIVELLSGTKAGDRADIHAT